ATPYLFKIAIDRAVVPDHLAVLNPLALVFLTLTALNLLAVRVETLTVGRVGQHTLHAVRCRLFAHLQNLPLAFYQGERSGGVVAGMVGDIESLTGLVSGGLMQLANNTATILGVAVILAALDWRLASETLTITPGLALAAVWYQKRSSTAWRTVRE